MALETHSNQPDPVQHRLDVKTALMLVKVNDGVTVKEKRLEIGLTQKELAERSKCCLSMISYVERGKARASLDVAVRIYKALHFDPLNVEPDPAE